MPRDRRANIGTGIWSEPSMRSLTRRQRDAYLLALTQADVNRCGVLPYRLRYLAGLATDTTPADLAQDYDDLTTSRHVIVDHTDELMLLRTYIKHDGLLSQPLVVVSMIRDYYNVSSPTIRTAILAELRRLWDDPDIDARHHQGIELTIGAKPADLGIKNAEKVATAIGTGLLGPFVEAIRGGHVDPFPAKGLPKGLTEGQLEGLTEGPPTPRYNARTPASVPATATATAPAAVPDEPAPPGDPTDTLLREHAHAYAVTPSSAALAPVKVEIMRLVADQVPAEHIRGGLALLRDRSHLHPKLLPQLVVEATNPPRRPGDRNTRVLDAAMARAQAAQDRTTQQKAVGQ